MNFTFVQKIFIDFENVSLGKNKSTVSGTSDFEVVPVDQEAYKLDPVGLAMGAAMVTSKKRKRDMIDGAFNR